MNKLKAGQELVIDETDHRQKDEFMFGRRFEVLRVYDNVVLCKSLYGYKECFTMAELMQRGVISAEDLTRRQIEGKETNVFTQYAHLF